MDVKTDLSPCISFVVSEREYHRLLSEAVCGLECGIISGGYAYFTLDSGACTKPVDKMRSAVKDGSFMILSTEQAVRKIMLENS